MTWQEAVMGGIGMVLFGTFVVVVIIQIAATWRARMSVTREDAYRLLAEEATRAHQKTAQQLEQMTAELSAIRERTSELERVLKEVEEPWQQ